jgi:hypothetical protein
MFQAISTYLYMSSRPALLILWHFLRALAYMTTR